MHDTTLNKPPPKPTSVQMPRRGRWRLLRVIGLLLLAVWATPWIVAYSPLRNILLGQLAAKSDWQVTTGGASFGWLTPVSLSHLSAEHKTLTLSAHVDSLRLDRTWWSAWLGLPAIGRIEVQSPEIEFVMPKQKVVLAPRGASQMTGEFVVHDAALRLVRLDDLKLLLELSDLSFAAKIESTVDGRVLSVEPSRLLDNVELTPELCDAGLQLVAPVLAKSTAVSGRASLELQTLQIPLDSANSEELLAQMDLEGSLKLQHVTTTLKVTVFRDLATVAGQLLGRKLPTTVRVSENTEVFFALHDGRVYHDGMTFLLPELSSDMEWKTRGSVGLDETLDLVVQTQLPFSLVGNNPLLQRLTDNPLEFRIVGTIDKPQLQLPPGRPWLDQAVQATIEETLPANAQPLATAAVELLEQLRANSAERPTNGSPTVLERMRERLQERREQRGEERGGLFGKKRRNTEEAAPTPGPDAETPQPGGVSL